MDAKVKVFFEWPKCLIKIFFQARYFRRKHLMYKSLISKKNIINIYSN